MFRFLATLKIKGMPRINTITKAKKHRKIPRITIIALDKHTVKNELISYKHT